MFICPKNTESVARKFLWRKKLQCENHGHEQRWTELKKHYGRYVLKNTVVNCLKKLTKKFLCVEKHKCCEKRFASGSSNESLFHFLSQAEKLIWLCPVGMNPCPCVPSVPLVFLCFSLRFFVAHVCALLGSVFSAVLLLRLPQGPPPKSALCIRAIPLVSAAVRHADYPRWDPRSAQRSMEHP